MAKKSQIRFTAISGSFPAGNDSSYNARAISGMSESVHGSLEDTLGFLANAVQRIHGASDWTNSAAGVFAHSGAVTIDSSGAGVSVDGSGESNFSTASGALLLDASGTSSGAGNVEINSAGGEIKIGHDAVAQKISVGADTSTRTEVELNAILVDVNAGSGGVTIDGSGAIAVTSSAGALDFDGAAASHFATSSGALTLDASGTSSGAGNVEINSAGGEIKIGHDAVAQKISVGADTSTRTEVELNAILVDVNAGSGGLTLDAAGASNLTTSSGALTLDGAGGIVVEANSSSLDLNSAGFTLDASTISIDGTGAVNLDTTDTSDGIKIGAVTSGVPITIGHTTSEVTVADNLTVTGDLTVNGATTTVDTTNLLVKDPVVLLASGAGSQNQNGGIVIEKGGSSSDADMVFGRVAADTWAVGTKDTSGGTATTLADMTLGPLRAGKLEIDSSSDHIDISGGNLVVTAGSSSADIVFSAAGGNVKPNADSSVSLGQPIVSTLDSSASSFSAFQISRLQESSLSSSTTSLSFSPEAGFTASAGEVVIFTSSGGDIAYEFSSDVGSSDSGATVSHNSSNSSVSSMNKSDISSVSRKQLTTTGAAWSNLYVDNIDLDGQGRIDLDDDQDTSIRSSADDQIDFEIGGSDVLVLTDGSLVLKGTTPKITIGDAGAEDTMLVFDGNAADFRIGLDDGTDKLEIGAGSSHGSTIGLAMDASGHVTQIGQSTHTEGFVLKFDGTKAVFESSAPTMYRKVLDSTAIASSSQGYTFVKSSDSPQGSSALSISNSTNVQNIHVYLNGQLQYLDATSGDASVSPLESFSSFQTSRLQESSLSASSTTSLTFSPEIGIELAAGEVIQFTTSSGTIAFNVTSAVGTSATSVAVTANSDDSTLSSANKSDISETKHRIPNRLVFASSGDLAVQDVLQVVVYS